MMPKLVSRLKWLLLLHIATVESTHQNICGALKRIATKTFNSLAIASCLMNSVCVPDAYATQESKLESLYHITKPLPFRESKERYQDLVDSKDKEALYNMNRYLIDYTFGTITTMFYDPKGEKFHDDLAWRSKLRRIEENGEKIYSSQFETNRVIENLIQGLDDEYTYYRSPEMDSSNNVNGGDNVDLGCARDCVRFPLLGFELRVFQPQNLDLHSYEYSELTGNREPESVVLTDGEVLESGRWVAVVNKIYPTSPAERAGLHVGDVLLDCDRVVINDLLSSPPPPFTPKKGLLDTPENTDRMKKDFEASYYRSKLRAVISPKRDPVLDWSGTFRGQTGGRPVRFSIVRTPRNSPSNSESPAKSGGVGLHEDQLVYHLSLTPDTPGLTPNSDLEPKRGPNKYAGRETAKNIQAYKSSVSKGEKSGRGRGGDAGKGLLSLSDPAKVRVTVEELHSGGTFHLSHENDPLSTTTAAVNNVNNVNKMGKKMNDMEMKMKMGLDMDMMAQKDAQDSASRSSPFPIFSKTFTTITSSLTNSPLKPLGNLLMGGDGSLLTRGKENGRGTSGSTVRGVADENRGRGMRSDGQSSIEVKRADLGVLGSAERGTVAADTTKLQTILGMGQGQDQGKGQGEGGGQGQGQGQGSLVSYVRITAFDRTGSKILVDILDDQVSKGTSLVVLDLRNNYGGVIQDAMLDASLFLDKPSDVLCYTVSPRGVGTHDVDEWLASWSPRVDMERKSRQQRLMRTAELNPVSSKQFGNSLWGKSRDRNSPHDGLKVQNDATLSASVAESSPLSLSSSPSPSVAVASGSALRAEIERSEVLGYIKSALVPSSVPVAVLTNGGTASAAEVFAAALQENGRATIVGTKSFGKSLIQHDFPLPNGGTLHMSVAEYLTPKKNHLTPSRISPTIPPSDLYLSVNGHLPLVRTSPMLVQTDASHQDAPISTKIESKPGTDAVTMTAMGDRAALTASLPVSPPLSPSSHGKDTFAATPTPTALLLAASLPPASHPTLPTTSVLALTATPPSPSPSLPPSLSPSPSPSPLSDISSAEFISTSLPTPRRSPHRQPTLPDSSDTFDDEIEEVSYGGIRPDVWCDDEPSANPARDLCTMEIISLML